MITVEYEAELSKRDQRIKELLERNQDLEQRNQDLEQEIKRLRELLNTKGESKASKRPVFKAEYSLKKNRGKRRRRKKSTGRRIQAQKLSLVSDTKDIYRPSVNPQDCIAHRHQYAWRIIAGKARYVRYTVYDLPDSRDLPPVPGLRNSRSEYGLEIILIVAFLHYWIGISLDHVCEVLGFFHELGPVEVPG